MSRKIIISGTGCALVDYLYTGVRFDTPQFQKYCSKQTGDGGLTPGNLVFTEELEQFSGNAYSGICNDITDEKSPAAVNIGGPGLVSLINCSQILNKEEFEVRFYGGTGNDETAELINQLVRKTPLNTAHYRKVSEKPTPFTDVFSDETYDNHHGERTFVNNIGAAWDYTSELLGEDFFKSDIVCFGGTALVPQIHDNLNSLLIKAKLHHCLTIVNTVFDFRNEKKNPGLPWPLVNSPENYRFIDLLIMDCEESLKISGKQTITEAADYFCRLNISAFIITNGAKELYAFSNGDLFDKTELIKLPVSKKVSEDFARDPSLKGDTTGCGDNFAGGVIASVAMQLQSIEVGKFNLTESISWGIASGGFTCYYLGGTYIETREGEKLSILKSFKNEYIQQIKAL